MSVRLKRTAAAVLAPTGALQLYRKVLQGTRNKLLVIGHHRVMPLPDEASHQGDVELVSATPAEFAWQVDYLSRHFEPVTCRDVIAALRGVSSLPRNAVAITFDDGFSDLYEHAMPILERARVPATVFIPTDYIDSGEPLWFDLIAYILMNADARSIAVPFVDNGLPDSNNHLSRREAVQSTLKWLKTCPDAERVAFIAHTKAAFPEIVAAGIEVLGRALNWDEMRDMAARGIEFGAHSASHPCLTRISGEALQQELTPPRQALEKHLGIAVESLAYPFGGRNAFSPAVTTAARAAGYRLGISYVPGINALPLADEFAVSRQHVERYTTRSYFKAIVDAPELFQ
ncbi:MAG: polysaccharide deacetylase family protein [Pseudomonadota bacterium]